MVVRGIRDDGVDDAEAPLPGAAKS
jgi:hypothetical protein